MGSGRAACAGASFVRVVIDHRERGSWAAAAIEETPGIGPKRAAALLETFGSIRAIMAADSDDLAAVNGMGSVTAAKIENVLREIPDGGASRTKPG